MLPIEYILPGSYYACKYDDDCYFANYVSGKFWFLCQIPSSPQIPSSQLFGHKIMTSAGFQLKTWEQLALHHLEAQATHIGCHWMLMVCWVWCDIVIGHKKTDIFVIDCFCYILVLLHIVDIQTDILAVFLTFFQRKLFLQEKFISGHVCAICAFWRKLSPSQHQECKIPVSKCKAAFANHICFCTV